MPAWIDYVVAALDFKIAPWILVGDDNAVLWFVRWRAYKTEVARAEAKKSADMRAKQAASLSSGTAWRSRFG